ncbi:hypothetical protein KFK09_005726 [Dendrobium nobile]|uniref:Uncharacterized protein n=1 Tax=Dendrobium nobile TaxID=94219 RepID=A0A8T3BZ42_DENNO|nr:hypothetical protein KFK09_005726 [Dendrobium nobile]
MPRDNLRENSRAWPWPQAKLLEELKLKEERLHWYFFLLYIIICKYLNTFYATMHSRLYMGVSVHCIVVCKIFINILACNTTKMYINAHPC